jgi:hypothetical protein
MGLLVAMTNRWQKARCAPPWLQWSQVQAQVEKREWTV